MAVDEAEQALLDDAAAGAADDVADEENLQVRSYFAYSMDRVSRITVTLICPG